MEAPTKSKKHPGGRPTKYNKDYHPHSFIELSKLGKNITQIALEWEVDRDTIQEWGKKHTEFSVAIKKGRAFCEGWYTNIGQSAMLGMATYKGHPINLNPTLYVWLTKNVCKWSDKIEQTIESDNTTNVVYDTQFGTTSPNVEAVQSTPSTASGAPIKEEI